MTTHTTAGERRLAATFACGASAVCFGGAVWAAVHLLGTRAQQTTDEAVASVFVALASACLVRLAWVCGAAALDILATPRSRPEPGAHGSTERAHRNPARARAASLFLALAAFVGSGAAAASATPVAGVSVTATTQAPSPDFAPQVPDGSPSTTPDFAIPPTSNSHTVPQECRSAPEPGWVPSSRAADAHSCRLVVPSGRAAETGTHVVLRGQNLWSIAAAHLPEGAPAELVADAVGTWIQANPDLRANPDVIQVGDVLRVPGATVGALR